MLKLLRLACETESTATESKLPGFDPSCELPVVEADFPAQPPVPLNAQPPPGKTSRRLARERQRYFQAALRMVVVVKDSR